MRMQRTKEQAKRGAQVKSQAGANDAFNASSQVVSAKAGSSASHVRAGTPNSSGAHKVYSDKKSAHMPHTRRQLFVRSSIFDFILVLILSTALVFTVSYGFESAPELRGNIFLEAGVCAVLLLALFAGSWSKKAIAPAAGAYLVLSIIIVLTLSQLMPSGTALFVDGQVNDVSGNTVVFGLILVIVPVLCYLLSRRTWGVAILFVLSVLACATIQFLYRDWTSSQPGTAASFIVYLSCAACYINQRYRQSAFKAHYAKTSSFSGAFIFSLVATLVCLLIGAAIFVLIIAPLNLSTPDIKPFQDTYQRPVIEYSGIYSEQRIDSPFNRSNNLSDEEKDTHESAESGQTQDDETALSENDRKTPTSSPSSSFDLSDWNESFQTVAYDITNWTTLIIVIVVVLLIVGIILARRSMRKWRLKKIADKTPSWQIIWIYGFLMKRFSRLGIRKAKQLTPLEFSLANAPSLEPYVSVKTHTDFFQVTLAYTRAAYGCGATAYDLERVKSFYHSFYSVVPHEVGRVKWLWKFWHI